MAWKARKAEERKKALEEKVKEESKKAGGGKNILSGKALFTFNPTLFKDDDNAVDEGAYEEEKESAAEGPIKKIEEAKEEEENEDDYAKGKPSKNEVANGEVGEGVDADLFQQEAENEEEEPDFD